MDSFALLSRFSLLAAGPNPHEVISRRRPTPFSFPPLPARRSRRVGSRGGPGFVTFALTSGSSDRASSSIGKELNAQFFASVTSSGNGQLTTSSANAPIPVLSSSSSMGSPLFWIGVGVGLSVIFQVVANRLKTYALQQAFKTMMNQAAPQGEQFSSPPFGSSPPFPFPTTIMPPQNPTPPPPKHVSVQEPVTVDVAPTKVESTSSSEVQAPKEESQSKKFAFVDVSPEELFHNERSFMNEASKASPMETQSAKEIQTNGTVKQNASSSTEQPDYRQSSSPLSVDALEKMMEDPTVQKMVYPYLPEEMRNPETFKWMMQNPQFRQQMQDMLNNMGGNNEWDNRLTDSLKNFNLNSPEVKQQFEQIGLTPEEVISKIMANPDVAMAFQNPKVQAAILDCSQNPLSIAKYQNDKEIMDVFAKISELFPGASGYP
ncbi:protein TIC 40, chloroplastic-like isoform X2 [Zingiber officinale]|uniref:protein TIC 40, chloroplastic-like isoform X2 n=1 Tax=Zingiber officinale TaxID=94328 RepID=UPI001C4B3668|nr:protein TIC 40, chloroplastic-like isoform X2 [Zingiber officinale]